MGGLVAVLLVGFLLFLLGAIVRLSIISPRRTRGGGARLRDPDPAGVQTVCGFSPQPELVQMYRDSPIVTLAEAYLVDRSKTPPKAWFIGGFSPLTAADVLERRKISGVTSGIPIADDLGKGTYFVTPTGSVMLRSPGVPDGEIEVAPTLRAFGSFEPREDWEEE